MKFLKLFIVFLCVILIAIGVTSYFWQKSKIVRVEEFQMTGMVGEHTGIGFNGSQIMFGMAPAGKKGTRWLKLVNNHTFPVEISFQTSGNISPYIRMNESVRLEPWEEIEHTIYFHPSVDAKYGTYWGHLKVIVKKV